MSQEFTIYADEDGSIVMFLGCAGCFYDVYDSEGNFVKTVGTESSAMALLGELAAA